MTVTLNITEQQMEELWQAVENHRIAIRNAIEDYRFREYDTEYLEEDLADTEGIIKQIEEYTWTGRKWGCLQQY